MTDTGVGIAPEHLGRLFDEFYQVDNHERDRHKGFGLGLAIARRLARQLGGDLAVASTVGRGSRFTRRACPGRRRPTPPAPWHWTASGGRRPRRRRPGRPPGGPHAGRGRPAGAAG